MDGAFFELMLDNIPHGIYILDDSGNYIYVNSTYVDTLGMSKQSVIGTNVHDFVRRKEIQFCISDVVYREKKSVFMLQDVQIKNGFSYNSFRQLVISNPVFDMNGNVQNIIAICTPLDRLNSLYEKAEEDGMIHMFSKSSEPNEEENSIVAESASMKSIIKMAQNIAKTDTSVLISGESGVGKEVIAQYLHDHSPRARKRLVVINCAALPENLLEAELFGYEKGAFTGASSSGKPGLMEEADGGTLFLDEINSLPLALQGKLLRALETKSIQRIGSTKTKKVDFRILSATNEDLEKAVEEKTFRIDLYYRLNVIPLHIPPLRERKEDIVPLAKRFLEYYNDKYEKNKRFTEGTLQKMIDYSWSGNVRELKNFVERTVVMSAGLYIEVPNIENITDTLSFASPQREVKEYNVDEKNVPVQDRESYPDGISLTDYVERCEREYLKYALERTKTTYEAAEFLKTSQSAIMRKKKKYDL